MDWERPLKIYAYDTDPRAIEAAKENAAEAGVADDIIFERRDSSLMGREFVPGKKDTEGTPESREKFEITAQRWKLSLLLRKFFGLQSA